MIIELRVYHCLPGRMPALHARFQNTTLAFFEKYGIRQVGFFTTLVGDSNHALTYMLEWDSLADREARWGAFSADQEWIAARAASERDAPIVARIENSFLVPTSYSAVQ